MTSERFSARQAIKETWQYFFSIWRAGFGVLWKSLVASVILAIIFVPVRFLGLLFENIPYMQTSTPITIGIQVGLGLILLAVYSPIAFYVAGSWVGFCKRVDPDGH